MTGYDTEGVSAQYSYNAEDYRVGKTVADENGIKNTRYFYEGSRVIMEADGTGNITAHNLYGTNLISRSVQGEGYYYLYNAHGDVVMLMDTATGEIAGTYRYDAFGNVIMQTGDPDNSITYAGYQFDEESGLYYLNARYYDSSTARFLTEDTFRGNYDDPLSLNRYTYCHNNPIMYTDPSGHFIVAALLTGLMGAAIGAGLEIISQKSIHKKEKIDWRAVLYEGVVGGISACIGGVMGGFAKTVGKVVVKTTVKSVAKKAVATGVTEAVGGFATDVGKQVLVDGKLLDEVDYGQAVKTGAISGLTGAGGYAVSAATSATKSVAKNTRSIMSKTVTKNADEAVEAVDDSIAKLVPKNSLDDAVPVKNGSATTNTSVSTKQRATTTSVYDNNKMPNKPNTKITSSANKKTSQTKTQRTLSKNTGISWSGKNFKSHTMLAQHYGAHGKQIADVLGETNYSMQRYLEDANYIIKCGTYVPELYGYIKFMRGEKYGFVGIDRITKDITTFHIKKVPELMKKAPSLGIRR